MSHGNAKRPRSALELPPSRWARLWDRARKSDVSLRVLLAAMAAVFMWLATGAWAPPFAYRTGYTPPRNITARVQFSQPDVQATEEARREARRNVICYYENDPQGLDELQNALIGQVLQVLEAKSYDKLDKKIWAGFYPKLPQGVEVVTTTRKHQFELFMNALADDEDLTQLKLGVAAAQKPIYESGLLENLEHKRNQGSESEIYVYTAGRIDKKRGPIDVAQVRKGEVADALQGRLSVSLQPLTMAAEEREEVAKRLFNWMRPRLPETLTWNEKATQVAAQADADAVPEVMHIYQPGEKLAGIKSKEPLSTANLLLLRLEHHQIIKNMTIWQALTYTGADFGMFMAFFLLCGIYIYKRERQILDDIRQYMVVLSLASITVALIWCAAADAWRAELVFIMLFGMTISIAYHQELALLLSTAVGLVSVISLGLGLADLVIMLSATAAAIGLARDIRSRNTLVYAGFFAAVVAFATTVGVESLADQPFRLNMLRDASWAAGYAVLAGIFMTGLLPFVEKLFDIQTDLSLLELGEASHPLLQELVRRAPGTYNHSINVGSIGEAAAAAIGANGLLVRVGAYFHDIGKMLKPEYFVENQGKSINRHDALLPAMSTLVIIAHVKDGADLARQNNLPRVIIDFIEQHHGTTLVQYFYDRASRISQADPDVSEVDEASFRYPGPKPQTKEAGVLMLSDTAESASRALVDPAPARIESLVRDITMHKLLDGQFDECGLTLQELAVVQESLVKSLTAVYHGRVKYPSKQKAV